jgi:putative transposase
MTGSTATQVLTIKCRLQPTRAQRRALEGIVEQQRQLYNAALAERIGAYRKWADAKREIVWRDDAGKDNKGGYVSRHLAKIAVPKDANISVFGQSKSLTQIRADDPAFAGVQRRIQKGTLDNLERAYAAFFRRAKAGDGGSSGFPKFRGRDFFHGFHFDAPMQITFAGLRLRFSGLPGSLRVSRRDARRLPASMSVGKGGTWKGISFKVDGDRWSACFQCEVPLKDSREGKGTSAVGVDWGTSVLAALSTGEMLPNQRHGEALAKDLDRVSRALARKSKGSRRRAKAKREVQMVHRSIANRRKNSMDKVSARLVKHWRTVAIETIDAKGLVNAERPGERPGEQLPKFVKTRRNRELMDAAPFQLKQMITYKATREGATFLEVTPGRIKRPDGRHEIIAPTQECFWCGGLHFKELTDAEHICSAQGTPFFGKRAPRKVNAARVILKRALATARAAVDDEAGLGLAGAAAQAKANRRTGAGRPRNTGREQSQPGQRAVDTALPNVAKRGRESPW